MATIKAYPAPEFPLINLFADAMDAGDELCCDPGPSVTPLTGETSASIVAGAGNSLPGNLNDEGAEGAQVA